MTEPSYLRRLHILNNRVDQDREIDLSPPPGRDFLHLILTGRNGSGKTTTLKLLNEELDVGKYRLRMLQKDGSPADDAAPSRQAAQQELDRGSLGVLAVLSPDAFYQMGEHCTYIGARRSIDFDDVKGPTNELQLKKAQGLEQYFVNLRTQVAYAREAQEHEKADSYLKRLENYEHIFRELFDSPDLKLVFEREQIRYRLKMDGRIIPFNALPDGFQSALLLWSVIRASIERSGDDAGIVIIDELEAHLHLALQEKLLPFLVAAFPKQQFVIATHSPAVISSIDGAIVYDLSSHTRVLSDELRGIQYGTLMTGHFGISSDFDLQSTQELRELNILHEKTSRTPQEDARLRQLAEKLSQRSHALALKVWNALDYDAA